MTNCSQTNIKANLGLTHTGDRFVGPHTSDVNPLKCKTLPMTSH